MFKRLKYFLTLIGCIKSYQKSPLPRKLNLSTKVKLVSAEIRAFRPHFLFVTHQIKTKAKVLVKIISKKDETSLEREYAAFQVMHNSKPACEGFRYPKIFGYDENVPLLIMEYVGMPTVSKFLKEENITDIFDPIVTKSVDWLRQLHEIKAEGAEIWSTDDVISKYFKQTRLDKITCSETLEFIDQFLEHLKEEANLIDDETFMHSFCHGDIHLNNLMWDGAEIHVLDFSEWVYAPPETDLSSLAFSFSFYFEGSIMELSATAGDLYGNINHPRLAFMTKVYAINWLISRIIKTGLIMQTKEKPQIAVTKIANIYDMKFPFG